MRALLSILFSAIVAFGQDASSATPVQVPANLTIPAQLSKTVDTKKCKAGDAIEMRTLEPVLIGKGIVMPEDAKLQGRILGASSRQNDRPSWVVLVIESARWKNNSVPLHAFVMSQITVRNKPVPSDGDNAATPQDDAVLRRRPRRETPQLDPRDDIGMAIPRAARDAIVRGKDTAPVSYHPLDDVRLMKDKNGTVFLLSQKSHLKIPSGTMLMLRQQTLPVSGASTTNAKADTR